LLTGEILVGYGVSDFSQIIGLQWTKVNRGATLQCNVDRFQLVL
jgi:hypothetical protein